MALKILRVLRKANLMHLVCDHVMGERHTHRHRMIAGGVVMAIGVVIAKAGGEIHMAAVHFIADGIGYLIHGIGAVPYVESLVALAAVDEEDEEK